MSFYRLDEEKEGALNEEVKLSGLPRRYTLDEVHELPSSGKASNPGLQGLLGNHTSN